ncbi:uroporphyrinogen decarboxylase family protein [Candidatus Contubernalis alkaliaceticus]|uniref:uroporphyrinogen decarboxylase family protein n=1 Tax=Candidatus Contubernalis alkaliaceticus TaxID=338645 RepID=UPI001F4C3476|nr:uroporphyrinogen decarboxylase family protein [Candidatus Contubernalis alkalaceticus]UNC90855.1 hypothetical protein HUE98_01395 [Candidatus Contubernalis alkalaceticus]
MGKLIEYVQSFDRRLVSPVGGGSREKFNKSVEKYCLNPEETLARWMYFQSTEYGHDLVFSTMPMQNIVKYLGFKTSHTKNGVEYVVENQLRDEKDFKKIKTAGILKDELYKPYISCISTFKQISNKLVGGACFGPFTVAGLLLGTERLCKSCIKEPAFLHKILGRITNWIIEMAQECEREGADFFWLAEPSAVLVSKEHFESFSGMFLKHIYDSISIPGFLHVPGSTNYLIDAFIKTGAQCLSLDSHVDMRDMGHKLSQDIVVLGNINSISLLQDSADEIEKQVLRLNKEIKNFPNFIVSSGGGLSPDTPENNLKALFNITRRFPVRNREDYSHIQLLWRTMADKSFEEVNQLISLNNWSRELILSSIQEACIYLSRRLKKREVSIDEYQKRMNEINKLMGTEHIDINSSITIEDKTYRLKHIKYGF